MIDIKHTEEGDIDLSTGDLVYTESTPQHQRDLLLSDKGEYKQSPAAGIGAVNYLNDNEPSEFLRAVRQELSRDGMKVVGVRMTADGQLEIEGAYEED